MTVELNNFHKGVHATWTHKHVGKGILWGQNPVIMTEHQVKTIDIDLIYSIMSEKTKSPSEIAEVKENDRLPVVVKIDRAWQKALDDYENDFAKLNEEDENLAIELKKKFTIYDTDRYITPYIYSFFENNAFPVMSRPKFKVETCVNRLKWIYETHRLEEDRHKDIDNELILALKPLISSLSENEKDSEKMKKINQIVKVYKAMFPTKKLLCNNIDVVELLSKIKA